MVKLSNPQKRMLTEFARRHNGQTTSNAICWKGGAGHKVAASLLKSEMIAEVDANKDDPIWRETGDGHANTLVITHEGLAALGTDAPTEQPAGADSAPSEEAAPVAATTEKTAPTPRANTKQAQMIDMLKQPEGATIDAMASELGWQKHTVRGAMAGALKKRLGIEIASETVEGRGRVYRIAQEA
jgi:hypothetical protein